MRLVLFVLLSVLGMLPATLLPVSIGVMRGVLGFSVGQAAVMGGVVIFSAALGALVIALVGVPARWKRSVTFCLILLVALDLVSIAVSGFWPLLALRSGHGLVGGMLTGVGYAMIGRAPAPDRLFGLLLALQFLIGGIAIAVLPALIAVAGVWLFFAVLAGAAVVMLLLVPIMPAVFPERPVRGARGDGWPRGRVLSGMSALFLIQAGHTAGGTFILAFGRSRGFDPIFVQAATGLGTMAGVIGAVGTATIGIIFGRSQPVLWAAAAGVISGVALLLLPSSTATFAAAMAIGAIAWAGSIPFVLGACAAADPKRDDAVWLSFVAKLGLAVGPVLAGLVVTERRFDAAIILSCGLTATGSMLFLRFDRARTA